MRKVDHNSPIPLHVQAETLLREMIKQPIYQEGELMPNEVELAKNWGIARNTLRQAINKLVFEGLLIRKKGVGTRVSPQKVHSRARNWQSFSQEMAAMGITVKNFELHVSWEIPPMEVSDFFGLKPTEKVLKLERLRGKPDRPFVYFFSYFHPQVGLTGEEDFTRPLYDILTQDFSVNVRTSREEISAMAASSFLSQKLELVEGAPVLKRLRFVFDENGNPVEYNVGFYRSDSFVYTIESERSQEGGN